MVESVTDFLGIDIKTLDANGILSHQTGLIRRLLGATAIKLCNELSIPNKLSHV